MSKESDKKDAAAQVAQDKADAKADAAQEKADAKDKADAKAADKFAADEDATAPTGVEPVARNMPLVPSKATGKYDLACVSNALNNVLNLRAVPGLDKNGLMAEFEAQLTEILDASSVAPDAWNKLVTRDQQESGSTFAGHTA